MIRLAFSSNAFKKNTLDEAIDLIAAAGYRGVEIMADIPHAYPPRTSPARIAHLRQRISDRGLSASNVNAFTLFAMGDTYHPTWIEDDPTRREARITHTLAAINLAAELGSATISLQPGGPTIGLEISRDQASRRFAEGIARILPAARRRGVVLAIEPEPGLLIESAEEYLQFKRDFFAHEPLVAMNCDIGHLYCVGDDPADIIRRNPAHIAHIHIEDIGRNHVHQHLPLGRGVIDFPALFDAINSINYKGWVTVELYPYETTAAQVAQDAMNFLSGIVEAVGPEAALG